jgi:two-component system response regulator DegU
MEPIKLMIVDDHTMIREGLKQLLELDGDIKIIGEAGEGKTCLNIVDSIKPDIILLDINMPQMSGLKVLEQLKINNCKSRVLILTIHNEIEYLMRAIELGADGYVLKDSESAVLRKAIFTIYNGERYVQNELAAYMNSNMRNDYLSNEDQLLTRREIEILKLLTEGLFNKEIAYQLSISEKTVKNHVSNIFKKISVSDRTQAAVYAIRNNIVEIY